MLWNKEELDRPDHQIWKLILMNWGLDPCSNVDRLYIPRTKGGRGLMSLRDCVLLERSNLLLHVVNSEKKLLKKASEELQLKARLERKIKEQQKNEGLNSWKDLYNSFTQTIPERNWRTEREKVALINKRRIKKSIRKTYLCWPWTGS